MTNEGSTGAMRQMRSDRILRLMISGGVLVGIVSGIIFLAMGVTLLEVLPLFVGVLLLSVTEELIIDD